MENQLRTERVTVSSDSTLLDLDVIVQYLSKSSYWAKGRSKERILRSVEHSLCFGIYKNKALIGFARVVTDYAVFAWIMDVFILPEEQSKGYGQLLMQHIMDHEELTSISRWGLNTLDAHGLYEKYGFSKVNDPSIHMEKIVVSE